MSLAQARLLLAGAPRCVESGESPTKVKAREKTNGRIDFPVARGTPVAIVRRGERRFRKVMDSHGFRAKYTEGLDIAYELMSPEQFAAFVRKEREEFEQLLMTLLGVKKE